MCTAAGMVGGDPNMATSFPLSAIVNVISLSAGVFARRWSVKNLIGGEPKRSMRVTRWLAQRTLGRVYTMVYDQLPGEEARFFIVSEIRPFPTAKTPSQLRGNGLCTLVTLFPDIYKVGQTKQLLTQIFRSLSRCRKLVHRRGHDSKIVAFCTAPMYYSVSSIVPAAACLTPGCLN
jgi:hypothetical protein